MTQATPFPTWPPALFDPGVATAAAKALLDAQRLQFDLLLGWQRACREAQQELFDEWVSHWGGGVPLDG